MKEVIFSSPHFYRWGNWGVGREERLLAQMPPSHPYSQGDLDSDTCHRSSQYRITAAADIINQGAGPRHSETAFLGGGAPPVACELLASWPGMDTVPPATQVLRLNHCTRDVLEMAFFLLFTFNGRITALQYWLDICHTSTRNSRRYTYVPSLLNLPPTSHPIPPL